MIKNCLLTFYSPVLFFDVRRVSRTEGEAGEQNRRFFPERAYGELATTPQRNIFLRVSPCLRASVLRWQTTELPSNLLCFALFSDKNGRLTVTETQAPPANPVSVAFVRK